MSYITQLIGYTLLNKGTNLQLCHLSKFLLSTQGQVYCFVLLFVFNNYFNFPKWLNIKP